MIVNYSHWLTRDMIEIAIGRQLTEEELQRVREYRAQHETKPDFVITLINMIRNYGDKF